MDGMDNVGSVVNSATNRTTRCVRGFFVPWGPVELSGKEFLIHPEYCPTLRHCDPDLSEESIHTIKNSNMECHVASLLSMNMPCFTGFSLYRNRKRYRNRLAFCTPNPNMLGSESIRSASMLQQRAGFFVGKPPQNDRKKQVSHYPVIAMERIVSRSV
jgi:hypothetical protein